MAQRIRASWSSPSRRRSEGGGSGWCKVPATEDVGGRELRKCVVWLEEEEQLTKAFVGLLTYFLVAMIIIPPLTLTRSFTVDKETHNYRIFECRYLPSTLEDAQIGAIDGDLFFFKPLSREAPYEPDITQCALFARINDKWVQWVGMPWNPKSTLVIPHPVHPSHALGFGKTLERPSWYTKNHLGDTRRSLQREADAGGHTLGNTIMCLLPAVAFGFYARGRKRVPFPVCALYCFAFSLTKPSHRVHRPLFPSRLLMRHLPRIPQTTRLYPLQAHLFFRWGAWAVSVARRL